VIEFEDRNADDQTCPLPVPESFSKYEKVALMAFYVDELRNQLAVTENAYSQALINYRKNPDILQEIFVRYINKLNSKNRLVQEDRRTKSSSSDVDVIRRLISNRDR
jgi:hypothetical protein